jgi:hypothetical protein
VGKVLDFLEYCDSQCVTIKFTMGSQQYSPGTRLFLNVFSIAPHFYLICFAQHCPHGSWNLSRWLNIGTCMCGVNISILGSL